VRVALDVPLPRLFDYAPPTGASVASGDRVTVPLGHRNQTGVVIETET
jgi:primosomal protein N' (replication factor Y)